MLTAEKHKNSLAEMAKRAAARKANPNLRHIPNEGDLRVVSEHAKIMVHFQYQTIKEDD